MTAYAGRVRFACGATIPSLDDPTPVCRKARDGRLRLVVYDTDRMPSGPRTVDDGDVVVANCFGGCKHKRAGGRRQERCLSEKKSVTWRWIVTCLGTWEARE